MICFLILLASSQLVIADNKPCEDKRPKDDYMPCNNQLNDIVFILDNSQSISESDYTLAKNSIIKAVNSVDIAVNASRVALVIFSDDAVLKFNLDTFTDKKTMTDIIEMSRDVRGATAIGMALKLTLEQIVPKMRNDATRIVLLFTDGTNTKYPSPLLYADLIRKSNVRIISVGIGSDISKDELRLIASENSVILVSTYTELMKDMRRILDHICHLPDPIPFKPCSVPQQDLVFVVDLSGSISPVDLDNSKRFVKNFISHSNLGPNDTRAAMITFSEWSRVDFNLDVYTDKTDYLQAVDRAQKFGTATGIGVALNEVINKILPKRRPSVPFNVIVITDGQNNKYPKPSIPAKTLKSNGAIIISVAVGEEIDFDELREIATNNKMITTLNYDELQKNVVSVERIITCG